LNEIEGLRGVNHDTREEPMGCIKSRAAVVVNLIVAGILNSIPADLRAEDYPSRTIHIISQTPPGGTADVITRLFADHLSNAFKQTVVVENKPGGGGAVAALFVSHSEPDGYTLFVSTPTITAFRIFQKAVDFDIDRDVTPVSLLTTNPYLVAVNSSVPSKTMAEFIAYTKANKGKVSYCGFGSGQMMAVEWLKQKSGADLTRIPFKGESPALQALISNDVQMSFDSLIALQPFMDAGQVRLLAVTSRARLDGYPNIPTVAETVPGFEVTAWFGLLGPKGLPDKITRKLAGEAAAFVKRSDIADKLRSLGVHAVSSTPEEFHNLLTNEVVRWLDVAQHASIASE
jgi:tripartite-type tricarboxylate transporter receptor subunit TctC